MENPNPNPPRSKPLGYDAMKAVLKSMSVEKRQDLHAHIPQLQTANALLPYKINAVELGRNYIQINHKKWSFEKIEIVDGIEEWYESPRDSDDDEDMQNSQKVVLLPDVVNLNLGLAYRKYRHIRLNESAEKAYNKLFNTYIKNGTIIKQLTLKKVPDFFNRKNPDDLKIMVLSLEIEHHTAKYYDKLIPFIDKEKLDCIEFKADERCFDLWERPEIVNCKRLTLKDMGRYNDNFAERLHRLRNHDLSVFGTHLYIPGMLEEWIEFPRPIGTCFTIYLNTFDLDRVYRKIGKSFEAVPAKHPRIEDAARCMLVKMSDGNDVIYHHEYESNYFNMEVVEGVKPAEDDTEGEQRKKRIRKPLEFYLPRVITN